LDKKNDELGVERQDRETRGLCERRGYTISEVIVDNDTTASKKGREGYERLMQLVEAGRVDVIVILRIDRLLRLNDELEQLIEIAERTAVKVITVEGDIDLQTPAGRLIARILVSVARNEIEVKSARHKLANAQKAASGKPHGSRRMYGYEDDLTTIHEPEAKILRAMAAKVIDGASYKEVAFWLNEVGEVTTQGKLFYPITVRNLLLKKRYGGIRSYKGQDFPAAWEPVFEPELWEQLQLTMRMRSERSNVPRGRRYLLTGMLFCGQCGMPLIGCTKADRPGQAKRRMYRCRTDSDTRRKVGCGGVRRGAEPLEHFIAETVLYRLDTPELGELLADNSDDAELRELLRVREAQQVRLNGLIDDYAEGLLDKDQLARAKTTPEVRLAETEDEIAELNRKRINVELPVGQTIRQAWERSDSDKWKRSVLGLLIKRIDVNPGITKPFYEIDGRTYRFDPSLIEVVWSN
jgi:DNA invertase Pin-like site-specific DNA recombinase